MKIHELITTTGNTSDSFPLISTCRGHYFKSSPLCMMSSLKMVPSQGCPPTVDEEATALRSVLRGDPEIFCRERSKCSYYHKPITLIIIGSTALICGIVHTVLYFISHAQVPYVLGPIFLSIGLMFLVTGLVWLPIVKETVRHKGILREIYARRIAAT